MKGVYWVVADRLAGRPGPECIPWNPEELAQAGFGGVVSLDGPIRVGAIQSAGLRHLAVYRPMLVLQTEQEHRRFLEVMPAIFAFTREIEAEGKATLIHCYHGADRTGSALACYLVARENVSAEEAIQRVQKINPDAMWAGGYMEVVQTFESLYRKDPGAFGDQSPLGNCEYESSHRANGRTQPAG